MGFLVNGLTDYWTLSAEDLEKKYPILPGENSYAASLSALDIVLRPLHAASHAGSSTQAGGDDGKNSKPSPQPANPNASLPVYTKRETAAHHMWTRSACENMGVLELANLNSDDIQTLAEWCKTSPDGMTTLDLSFCEFGSTGASAIAEALEGNTILKILKLAYNKVCDDGAEAFANALNSNTTLTSLDFLSNKIGDAGTAEISWTLKSNTTLTTLKLEGNYLGDAGGKSIAEALNRNATLKTLNLASNDICTEGAEALANAVENNTALTALNLRYNNIGAEGGNAFANALKNNISVKILNLGHCNIGFEGAKAFAEMVKGNTNLTTLDLRNNDIGVEGARAIAEAMKINFVLTELTLLDNTIGDESVTAIVKIEGCLEHNRKLSRRLLEAEAVLTLMTKASRCAMYYVPDLNRLIAHHLGRLPADMNAFAGLNSWINSPPH